jgi:hypothetical protein
MKLSIGALLTLFLISGCTSTSIKPVKWEYKTINVNPFKNGLIGRELREIEKEYSNTQKELLSKYGEDGWELVHIEGKNYIFKRPVQVN